ncbi:MAG: TIGR00266 family protein [Leptospira sp.]|nr:TIGR00266 family protein [Leptospira sp.]
MDFQISHQPSYAMLKVNLAPGDNLKAEAGAMVYMSPGLNIETKMGSGLLSALKRRFFGGESFFFNYFSANSPSKVALSPMMPGDIVHMRLSNEKIMIQTTSYLASTDSIQVTSRFGGLKTLFGGEGLFLLEASGSGDLFVNSYGAVVPIDVSGKYIIDTGHIVAFQDSLTFNIRRAGGGWKTALLSGEGFVCEFSGKGRVWIQTRVPSGVISWLTPLLPK